ncbi:hypothetical protein RB2501_14064 [Robiginitalea biformata HTCC2501]|uniref:Uncharacterized protein n=2 Tax=Robiginitalea TaxID=252306 RepID=A4CKR0_ROBBH|nr:hypothetical protein RB2501_14064 [Robiginitalea biformata HTCC2501]
MQKGQLPMLGVMLLLAILFWRLPADEIPVFFDKVLSYLQNFANFGWILFGISLIASYVWIKWQRRIHTREVQRMADEKRRLQQELDGRLPPTSN